MFFSQNELLPVNFCFRRPSNNKSIKHAEYGTKNLFPNLHWFRIETDVKKNNSRFSVEGLYSFSSELIPCSLGISP